MQIQMEMTLQPKNLWKLKIKTGKKLNLKNLQELVKKLETLNAKSDTQGMDA